MDSERFDRSVRSVGQARSRRQTLRAHSGAGALVALLAAKPVAAGKTGKPNPPKNHSKNPGKGQLSSGQNGPIGPGLDCEGQCGSDVACIHACERP